MLYLLDHFFPLLDSWMLYVILYPAVWYFAGRELGAKFFYIVTLSYLTNTLLKELFDLPRPNKTSPGFPSGSAQSAILFASIIIYESRNKVFWTLGILFGALLCYSRIYLNMHYTYQIFGGIGFGAIFVLLYIYLLTPIAKRWEVFSLWLKIALLAGVSALMLVKSSLLFGSLFGAGVGLLLAERFVPKIHHPWLAFTLITLLNFGLRYLFGTSPPLFALLGLSMSFLCPFLTNMIGKQR